MLYDTETGAKFKQATLSGEIAEPAPKRQRNAAQLHADSARAVQAAAASAAAAAEAAKLAAAAASGSGRASTRVLDPDRPVAVELLEPRWGFIGIRLSLREKAVSIKERRANYEAHKAKLLEETRGLSNTQAAKRIQSIPGFEKVDACQVGRWQKSAKKVAMQGGRPVDLASEQEVIDEMIFCGLETVGDSQRARVEANVMYNNAVIERAAKKVQAMHRWRENDKVQALQFTRKWIKGLLKRHKLRRKRITAAEKVLPEPAEVQARMSEIQTTIKSNEFTEEETISADETAVFFGAAPTHQVVPADAARATAPESNEKARFTDLLWGNAAGEMGPPWHIIKCTVQGYDLSTVQVLKTLHLEPGFTAAEGWLLKMWEHKLTLLGKNKKEYTAVHKRPYLINEKTLEVVTVQHRAWMDTPGVIMWAQVQLQWWAARRTGRVLVVWDNCGPHKTQAVQDAFKEMDIFQEELPPKMTDILQVGHSVSPCALYAARA